MVFQCCFTVMGKMWKAKRTADHNLTRSSKNEGEISSTKSVISGDLNSGSNQDVWAILSVEVASNLSKSVVSLALSDGNTLIYACSGIAIECQEGSGTIFLTSASLVRAFYDTEEVYDNLKIEVCHEGNEVLKVKYDLEKNFAVVYTMESLDVHVVLPEHSKNRYANKKLVAVGHDKYGVLMAKSWMVAGCRDSNRSEDSKEIRLISVVNSHYDTNTS